MKKIVLPIVLISQIALSQQAKKDSIKRMEELKLIGIAKKKIESDLKMSVSVDEFLATSEQISFIKRGAYAWEPMLNNLSSERSVITIDGMHIFGACTDKMDPVTSYVEVNNLSTIDIKSGQQGSMHGSTLSGSIDLKLKNSLFSDKAKFGGSFQTGFEFNNKQIFNLGNLNYSSERWIVDASISHRKAENYHDGKGNEVHHSQFRKMNASLGIGYKTSLLSSLRVDAIFDMAKNVGYPALPMDLWLSRAIITSASYKQLFEDSWLKAWDTKIYFNAVEHYMDDTTRPENIIHMDMPGWSTTYGMLSKMNFNYNRFLSEVQLNAYQNTSIAEMKMYPFDRSKRTMFAYTWPWVTTKFIGLSFNNSYHLSDDSQLNFGGSMNINYNHSKYVEFNRIFYPFAKQEQLRFLPSANISFHQDIQPFYFSVGGGYGERAASVSEGYAYYIYNSFDRYDYIGNPNLKNEISHELNASLGFKNDKAKIEAKANYFYIRNYIVGEILNVGSPMNYQSVGVKAYTSLDYAKLFNLSLNAKYDIIDHLHWTGIITYARAEDNKKRNLPFIRPFSYRTALQWMHDAFNIQTSINGDLEQNHYSSYYGEDKTPSYMVWNASVDYSFFIRNCKTIIQVGVENILNKYYSTYADWGNIPRMGRNFFTSLKFNF